MTNTLPTVLIPVADANGSGAVCEITAQKIQAIAAIRGFDPTIARLADVELIEAGQVALDASGRARGFLPRASFRLTKPKSHGTELFCANTAQMRGLNTANATSAELGLLLALIMHGRDAKPDLVAATGRISPDPDVSVGAVEKIREKCAALADWVKSQRFDTPKTMLFATPALDPNQRHALEALNKTCASHNVTLTHIEASKVAPILDSLRLSASKLGKNEHLARAAVGAALLVGAGLIWFSAWLMTPPQIGFSTLPWALGDDPQTPLRVRIDRQIGQTKLLPTCFGPDQRAMVLAGEHLTLRVRTTGAKFLDQKAGLVDVAIIALGAQSQPFVFKQDLLPLSDQLHYIDGELEFGAALPVLEPAEAMKVVVLMKKGRGIRFVALKEALNTAFDASEPGEARLADLAGIAVDYGQVSLVYDFRSVVDPLDCEAQ